MSTDATKSISERLAELSLPDMDEAYGRMKLFPLYLCPFELYLYHDSKPDYPMTFIIHMDFIGQVDRECFEAAVDAALDRHRVIRATIEPKKKGRLCWVYRKDLPVKIRWQKEGEPFECPEGITFDGVSDAGVRLWIHQGEENCRITFYFNHVATDGIGSHQFIGDLLAIYANLVDGPGTAQLIDLDPTLLKNRGFRQRYGGDGEAHSRSTAFALTYLLRNGIIGCQQIYPPRNPAGLSKLHSPLFGVVSELLSREEHQRLREQAIKHGVTVNDLLAVEAFMVMQKWNAKYRRGLPGFRRKYKMIMPTNLRGRDDDCMPAVNMTSYNFMARKPSACSDRVLLLKSIRDETRDIKNNNLGTEFIEVVSHGAQTPWAMKVGTTGRRSLGSIVFSSVGDPTRRYTARLPRKKGTLFAGGLELLDCSGAPPLRDKTRAVLSTTTYKRQLSISLRCDPRFFTPEQSREMMDMFMEGLNHWHED